jgi:DNA-binding response OmpR family regulator
MRRLDILLVERDDGLASHYIERLAMRGHRIRHERDDASALAAADPHVDVVIVHADAPNSATDGLLSGIRARPEYANVPILMLTAAPPPALDAYRGEVTAIRRIPFPLRELVRYVEELAGRDRFAN